MSSKSLKSTQLRLRLFGVSTAFGALDMAPVRPAAGSR
jgi:hypothetical protein